MRKLLIFFIISFVIWGKCSGQIVLQDTSSLSRYAASELQRYHRQLFGKLLPISLDKDKVGQYLLSLDRNLGSQSYKLTCEGSSIKITGGDPIGLLYGVYGLLEDHIGVRFYFSGDVLPEQPVLPKMLDEIKRPAMRIRGILPWTNFPQSATIYSWNDWQYIIDQCAKMRMNFIMIHNYNGFCGHNEMFHNFIFNNHVSRGWFATVKTGHGWGCPGWNINEYRFGASSIYPDYDFGADCTLHNETLTDRQVYEKGITAFRHVIAYAHTRGVKIGLGLDIDVVMPDYGADASNEDIVHAQVKSLVENYPDLDYLLCFQSESNKDQKFYARWNKIFDQMYREIREYAPKIQIAVSGWGITAESAASLPQDVICAPIAPYSASFESGRQYSNHEAWGCPWMERDFNGSEYYYPYNMDLSETIKAYRNRSENMTGLYTLTWRLTDAVSAKIWYVSKAPWWSDNMLDSSEKVYYDYALHNYGSAAAESITAIINQNEVYATDFGECQTTPGFNDTMNDQYLFNIRSWELCTDTLPVQKIEATNFNEKNGTQNVNTEDGGQCVGFILNNQWLKYSIQIPNKCNGLRFKVASATIGGKISVRLDRVEGVEIANLEIKNTSGWQVWESKTVPIKAINGKHDVYLVFTAYSEHKGDESKGQQQLKVIDHCISITSSPSMLQRLNRLHARIEGATLHANLNENYGNYNWKDFPGDIEPWAKSFLKRIDDISSFGNIMSVQNRFIQQNYVKRLDELRAKQAVKAPSHVYAYGTKDGTIIQWHNEDKAACLCKIYRDTLLIATLPASTMSYRDHYNGTAKYSVLVVNTDGAISPKSIPASCNAGSSDAESPYIIFTSPLQSITIHEPWDVRVALYDNRDVSELSIQMYYRQNGAKKWSRVMLQNRVRDVFGCRIPIHETGLIEYYILASDGTNLSRYPVDSNQYATLVCLNKDVEEILSAPIVEAEGNSIRWKKVDNACLYRIYRSVASDFMPSIVSFVTYVPADMTYFIPNGIDFNGISLNGRYYYRVVPVDSYGREGKASNAVNMVF